MREAVAAQLLRLNSGFYQTLAGPFAETRSRLQPGVVRSLRKLKPEASVLDLGCGSGTLARELARAGHRGGYLGVDSSPALLATAQRANLPATFRFVQADITTPKWRQALAPPYDVIFAFAVLHHIPGEKRRRRLAEDLCSLLAPDGEVMLSTWDFWASPRLRARIQPWERVGLTPEDVDPGDYLLDWRQGATGLRYVHLFEEEELRRLAAAAGFDVIEAWRSDGEGGRLGIYQRWVVPVPRA